MKKSPIKKVNKAPETDIVGTPTVELPKREPLKFISTEAAAADPESGVWVRTRTEEHDGIEVVALHELFEAIGDKPVEQDVSAEGLAEIINEVVGLTAKPLVRWLPPNPRIVIAQVGEHMHVRIMVRPNNKHYLPGMEIPMNVSLANFNPDELLIFNGDPPRRKGQW